MNFPRRILKYTVGYLVCLVSSSALGQPSERIDQSDLLDSPSMRAELQRLADICDRLGLDEPARQSRQWLPGERSDQRVIYLPSESLPAGAQEAYVANWQAAFSSARRKFAKYLFERAGVAASEHREAEAFQLLWQVLREDPTHVAAKRILGPLATAHRARPQVSLGAAPHPQFKWPARSYSRLETAHFSLISRADRRESVRLAQQLEEFYALWSQLFYAQWAAPGLLSGQFTSPSPEAWPQPRDIQVVLLRDREEYVETLGVAEANIGVSVGYYAPQAEISFFYPDPNLAATLQHELTHQLLAEATKFDVQEDYGSGSGFWMLEGIALYLESLQPLHDYWTIGGFEAPRMQSVRYRGVRDRYWHNWADFCRGSGEQWKRDPQVSLLYTHAAGLTHVFMDHLPDSDQARQAYFQALESVYQGEADTEGLLSFLAADEPQAKLRYAQLLTVSDRELEHLSRSGRKVQELVVAGSQLSSGAWDTLAEQTELQWLDISFSNATSTDLDWLGNLKQLRRLSLEGTRVDSSILDVVAQLPHLEELDLSGCALDDDAIKRLKQHASLQTLWLTGTRVSDACLETLASLPALRACDIQGTDISAAAWRQFVQQRGW